MPQGFDRAHCDLDAEDFGIYSGGAQLCVWRDAIESLNDVQQAQLRLDCDSFPTCKLRRNRERGAEKSLTLLDMTASLDGNIGYPLEVLRVWCNDDIHVLRSADDSPSIDRKPADEDELDFCLREPAKKLIEGRLGQVRRAAPVNRIN